MAHHHDRYYCGKCGLTYVYAGNKALLMSSLVEIHTHCE
ncbi:unnamed protein product [Spirodela intermedia]|uniref:Small ribosomal subunit protein eS31 domain-containing protein n=1 Tax=Spirodela intermedia TaxID=51605 RepID=A0A7I8I7F6_SPIIN|nr:unnamed protein product [Spirodela intermedia]CAA6653515.1 unnamed protein product [Spirodela intermedia]